MNYPNIFITETFLENLDELDKQLSGGSLYNIDVENEDKKNSLRRIRDLLLSSNIYTDIKDKKLVKYFKEQKGNIENTKELVFRTIIKENAFTKSRKLKNEVNQEDCVKSNFCYFTNNNFEDCELQSKEMGKIILGNDFLSKPFYLKQTFPGEPTNARISQIEDKAKHPCSSLVIIDKYIFEDSSKYELKMPNLIHFLKQLMPDSLSKPFELDIITGNPQNNAKVQVKYDEILEVFKERISLKIYAPIHFKNDAERYLITNYATLIIHHPFDRNTDITCSFFPSNIDKDVIKTSFMTWVNKLNHAKEIINETPMDLGIIKCVWQSDTEKHSIFDLD